MTQLGPSSESWSPEPSSPESSLPPVEVAGASGFCDPQFAPVAAALAAILVDDPGGAAACVYHRGRCVADLWGGVAHPDGRAWEPDTLAVSFSTTKGVTATALHICADHGWVDYDDPVAEHWPEFAQAGKEAITVRHLLCHEAGLYDLVSLLDTPEQLLDWDAMTRALERAAPAHEPGTANGYHAVTFGYLVGEVVRRVSGRSITEFVQREIAGPLDLDGCHIGLPESELGRLATLLPPAGRGLGDLAELVDQVDAGREGSAAGEMTQMAKMAEAMGVEVSAEVILGALGGADTMRVMQRPDAVLHPIPAANGCFTARSLARLYACLAAGGELDGVRLLSEETRDRAIEVQNDRPDRVIVFPLNWRLGYHLVFTSTGLPPRGFGHNGFGGSGGWADPDRGLACAMTLNALGSQIQGDLRFMQVGGAAIACADTVG